jgi:hypothetical protein
MALPWPKNSSGTRLPPPASAELQWGKMFTQKYGAYVDGLVEVGGYRPYDYGFGIGVRMMF